MADPVAQLTAEVAALKETVAQLSADAGKLSTTYASQSELAGTWMLLCAFIIFSMQAGFALLEVGAVRSKNARNIMMRACFDACAGALAWWATGYAFAGPWPDDVAATQTTVLPVHVRGDGLDDHQRRDDGAHDLRRVPHLHRRHHRLDLSRGGALDVELPGLARQQVHRAVRQPLRRPDGRRRGAGLCRRRRGAHGRRLRVAHGRHHRRAPHRPLRRLGPRGRDPRALLHPAGARRAAALVRLLRLQLRLDPLHERRHGCRRGARRRHDDALRRRRRARLPRHAEVADEHVGPQRPHQRLSRRLRGDHIAGRFHPALGRRLHGHHGSPRLPRHVPPRRPHAHRRPHRRLQRPRRRRHDRPHLHGGLRRPAVRQRCDGPAQRLGLGLRLQRRRRRAARHATPRDRRDRGVGFGQRSAALPAAQVPALLLAARAHRGRDDGHRRLQARRLRVPRVQVPRDRGQQHTKEHAGHERDDGAGRGRGLRGGRLAAGAWRPERPGPADGRHRLAGRRRGLLFHRSHQGRTPPGLGLHPAGPTPWTPPGRRYPVPVRIRIPAGPLFSVISALSDVDVQPLSPFPLYIYIRRTSFLSPCAS